VADGTLPARTPAGPRDVRISKATAQAAQPGFEFALKIGGLKEIPKFEDMIDFTLFDEVAREHPEYFNDLPPIPGDLSR
jgi:hypothetical protein